MLPSSTMRYPADGPTAWRMVPFQQAVELGITF
jgi:hypothetical protein